MGTVLVFILKQTSFKRFLSLNVKRSLHLYNSLTRNIELASFNSRDTCLNWYICGPTVYDHAHIGHARTFVCFDILKRVLKLSNTKIKDAMSITDIDDKIINRIKVTGESIEALTLKYHHSYIEDMKALKVDLPLIQCRVSDYIPEMIDFIKKIKANGMAYAASDASIYFDMDKYCESYPYNVFGLGSKEQESSGSSSPIKKSSRDFVLWKAAKVDEPNWSSPWGNGRPGWHIECSAMSSAVFENNIDLHSGGIDLCFPHHENEIAQCQAFYQYQPWCPFFSHTAHVHVQGSKMSKSLANSITVKEFLKNHPEDIFRLLCLRSHYRKTIEFSNDKVQELYGLRKKLVDFFTAVGGLIAQQPTTTNKWSEDDNVLLLNMSHCHSRLLEHVNNDLDTHKALDEVLLLINQIFLYIKKNGTNRQNANISLLKHGYDYLYKFLDQVFGLQYITSSSHHVESKPLDHFIHLITDFRSKIRNLMLSTDSKLDLKSIKTNALLHCDELRTNLKEKGIQVSDVSNESSMWSKINDA